MNASLCLSGRRLFMRPVVERPPKFFFRRSVTCTLATMPKRRSFCLPDINHYPPSIILRSAPPPQGRGRLVPEPIRRISPIRPIGQIGPIGPTRPRGEFSL